jgi:hypothetical protein
MVESIHSVSNLRFDMSVALTNYSFIGRWRPRQQRGVCGDFVNLKIGQTSLSKLLIGVVCVCVLIGVSEHAYMSIYVCIVFLKKDFFLK